MAGSFDELPAAAVDVLRQPSGGRYAVVELLDRHKAAVESTIYLCM